MILMIPVEWNFTIFVYKILEYKSIPIFVLVILVTELDSESEFKDTCFKNQSPPGKSLEPSWQINTL